IDDIWHMFITYIRLYYESEILHTITGILELPLINISYDSMTSKISLMTALDTILKSTFF
ncbi:9437_t:CDS:1, partial [Gigaspora rosea]